MLEMRLCSAYVTIKLGLTKFGNQAKPLKYSKKKKVVFRTNLERMFKYVATDLHTQPTKTQQRLTCALKMPGSCVMVAATSTVRAIRSSAESTGDV